MLAVTIYPQGSGGQSRDRTGDTRIFSPVLYQLSYLPKIGKGMSRSRKDPSF